MGNSNKECEIPENAKNEGLIYVGYGNVETNFVLILISLFGIIINTFFVFNYLKV